MKRFFCNTCQRIKRVRRLPDDVTINYAENLDGTQSVVGYSAGKCRYHTDSRSRTAVNGRVRAVSIKPAKVTTAPSFKNKPRKG